MKNHASCCRGIITVSKKHDSDDASAAVKGVAHCTSVWLHDLIRLLESTGVMAKAI